MVELAADTVIEACMLYKHDFHSTDLVIKVAFPLFSVSAGERMDPYARIARRIFV